ncbi:rho GTPase-activating protein 20 isoform X2 [Latimeria chalumnae]
MEDKVQLTTGLQTQERHLFLFSNMLVIAKSKSSSSLKLKKQVHLCEMWTASCVNEVSEKKMSTENSFVIGWPTTNCIITFSSSEVKEKWLSALQWQINEMKRDEYPKETVVNVLFLDAGDGSSTTPVTVSNTETADKLIKTAVQQLGIPGRSNDYHLWVISGKEEAPYPLIGHEHPFSIIMSCLRDFVNQPLGTNLNVNPADNNEPFCMEQLPKERRCQFILKPRSLSQLHLRREPTQKQLKKTKSLLDWALRRSTSTPSGSPVSESPTMPRKLFGLSLSSVCENGALPKPIMDMLLLLYHEGPSTKGIFRRSANAKTCKELKEKLNSGNDVQMDGESVFVAAAVITDFLRNIPDSVLSSEMYELWMEAMEIETQENKIQTMKRLVRALPEANVVLLHHLFGVLYHIEKKCHENQMNAFNLGLCIAPNMLWLPSPTGPEEESKSTKKVATLVQFLIENCPQIFGEGIISLFGSSNKEQQENSEDLLGLPDVDLLQQHDSSDELESPASDQEPPKTIEEIDAVFEKLNSTLLEKDKDWDLIAAIDACYKDKSEKNDSAESCENLVDESFHSCESICSLGACQSIGPPRDRCSSEPCVCLSSQLPAQSHEPVARQSSYDATVSRDHVDYVKRLRRLPLERQKLKDGSLSHGLSRSKYSFWRSPQIDCRAKKHIEHQRTTLSNRSSFSSLSSTTTSPSASSLSSLDSAFSYCSDSSVFSPPDISSLPFMFGTSTRIQTAPPEVSKKNSKESGPIIPSQMAYNPGDLNKCYEYDEQDEENNNINEEGAGFTQKNGASSKKVLYYSGYKDDEDETESMDDLEKEEQNLLKDSESCRGLTADTKRDVSSDAVQKNIERSMKYIQLKKPDSISNSKDKLKRTKITFYMASNQVPVRAQPEQEKEGSSPSGRKTFNAPGEDNGDYPAQTLRVHIPQTVFYGQNASLVLQSVPRAHPEGARLPVQAEQQGTTKDSPTERKLLDSSEPPVSAKSPSKTANTLRHTIRIILPTSVRNTVKEYFMHNDAKSFHTDVNAVEKELLRSRLEWQNRWCSDTPRENLESLTYTEESFV